MRPLVIAAGLAAAGVSGCATAPSGIAENAAVASPERVAADLLATDRAFAASAASLPATDAIARMIDRDVVMFIVPQPHQARGEAEARELLTKAFAGNTSALTWSPVRVGVSADAQQGFSYGFASRTIAGKDPELYKYVAYWIRRPQGWRLAAYKLVPRAAGAVSTELRAAALPAALQQPVTDAAVIARYRDELDKAERAFSDESGVIGLGPAFSKYGSADAMNVGGGADFTYGNEAIGGAFGPETSSPLRWAPDGVLVSSSGDLGITYGYLQRTGPVPPGRLARIPWFTVWRRPSPDAPWRYVAE